MMNKNTLLILAAASIAAITSCINDTKKPGYTYMPDMAKSVAVETYDQSRVQDLTGTKLSALKPPVGTIPYAQGHPMHRSDYMPYHHPNNTDGEMASENDKNPLETSDENIQAGKRSFEIYCAPCHGVEGKADGSVTLANNHAFPMSAGFSYFTDVNLKIPEGRMFYYTQYGKGIMGSYATQLNTLERWQVIMYVKKMQADYIKSNMAAAPKAEEKTDPKKKS